MWEEFVSIDPRQISVSNLPQERQDDGVITAKCHYPGVILTVERDGRQRLSSERVVTKGREGRPVEELLVTLFDLLDGILVVIRRDGDIATINEFQAREERIDFERNVVASVQSQAAGSRSDSSRAETRPGPV